MSKRKAKTTPQVRCAIYTRKSSEEGLQQEFNSLDAQREAAEAYIASQKSEGWMILSDRYDDGGFTGGNIERPALRKLVSDIEAGKIDTVVVYKVDRLSRSLMDFARLMETFEKHNVSFVSVTQHFNTTHSMGRLTLNILLSFAQFEREIIGERIRDKIAASRQRGRWTGGVPILGYDVDRSGGSPRLVVNPAEATKVRRIFDSYLEQRSLLAVVKSLNDWGWRTKVWTAKNGNRKGGREYDKGSLYGVLTNVLYAGKVCHKEKVYDGVHEAIVDPAVFDQVQQLMQRNGKHISPDTRNRHGALLRGLLFCKACGRAMTHTFTTKGKKRYRYYTCTNVIKRGRKRCSTPSLPSEEIERVVVEQLAGIGRDPTLIDETVKAMRSQSKDQIKSMRDEQKILKRSLSHITRELRQLAGEKTEVARRRSVALLEQQADAEGRVTAIEQQLTAAQSTTIDKKEVTDALADFDQLWEALTSKERVRLIHLLISRVAFDGTDASVEIAFHPTGIQSLGQESLSDGAGHTNDAENNVTKEVAA